MKILMHIDSFGSGGAQRQIVILALGLASRGNHVEFNTYIDLDHFRSTVKEAGIPIRTRQKRSRFSLAPVRDLIAHARDMKADAIIAFLRVPAVHAELAGLFLPGCTILVSERASVPNEPLPWKFVLLQQFHRLADLVTVNSSDARKKMAAAFPWIDGKLSHVLNGYDLGQVCQRDGKIGETLTLLVLASVNRNKNALCLAKALRICVQDLALPVRVKWAGEPTLSNGACAEKEATDSFLEEHGLTDYWTWLGLVDDTASLFEECDALIHTSLSEGFSNAIAEALLNATPVLIGRINDQPALVEESQAGLLFDPADPSSIAEAIARFAALGEEARATMSNNAIRYAQSALSIEAMVDRYEALLRGLEGGT